MLKKVLVYHYFAPIWNDMTKGRENEVSALDGMMKPEEVATKLAKAIKNEDFLISPHDQDGLLSK